MINLSLSESAEAKVEKLIGDNNVMLRIYIQGGGCSGFMYGFAYAEETEDGDFVIEQGNVKLVVDPLSAPYLNDVVVDWVEELAGSRFVINNPNASASCGCGQSFA